MSKRFIKENNCEGLRGRAREGRENFQTTYEREGQGRIFEYVKSQATAVFKKIMPRQTRVL